MRSTYRRSSCKECMFKKNCSEQIYESTCPCIDCIIKVTCELCCDEAKVWFRSSKKYIFEKLNVNKLDT